ncbi:MAG: hypothetical protein ACI9BK_000848 [Acidimicrobiales bacterium]|jgi:hypothetical protein
MSGHWQPATPGSPRVSAGVVNGCSGASMLSSPGELSAQIAGFLHSAVGHVSEGGVAYTAADNASYKEGTWARSLGSHY